MLGIWKEKLCAERPGRRIDGSLHGILSAGVWMAAAIGVTVGLGAVGLAAIATVLSLAILAFVVTVDNWLDRSIVASERSKKADSRGSQ